MELLVHSGKSLERGVEFKDDALIGADNVEVAEGFAEGFGKTEGNDGEIIAAKSKAGEA